MPYNIEALTKLRDSIESDRKHHNQSTWGRASSAVLKKAAKKASNKLHWSGQDFVASCPTTACAAGWTVTNEGAKMLFDTDQVKYGGYLETNYCLTETGQVASICSHAADILGLDFGEADLLFSGSTSTSEVLGFIDEIIAAAHHDMTWYDFRAMSRRAGLRT